MKTARKLLSVLLAVLMLTTTMAIAAVPAQAYSAIQFGNYPQTKVTATTALSNAAANATWKSYNYYIGNGYYDGEMYQDDFMKYADFFSGGVKYRAVKFTQFRPRSTRNTSSASNSYQDDNGYSLDTTYYFKYEPLTWRVLDASTGLIVCDSIIDSQAYQNSVRESGGDYYYWRTSTYANDYVLSTIRTWLNNDFYNTAFNSAQKENIKSTTVDNTATNRIYLLSYSEAQNSSYGLSSASARKAKGTDYAKCQGLYVKSSTGFSSWRLRSAGIYSDCTCFVAYDGDIGGSNNYYYNNDVSNTDYGIRPACKLSSLTSDTTMADVYTISASADPSAGGTVTGAGAYGKGETVTLTATPKYGYNFTGWYRGTTRVTTNTSYSFTVSADAAYTAKFSPLSYTVTANAGTGGSVTGGGTFAYNTSTTVKATPSTGYTFNGWYKGNTRVSTSANYTFTVTESVSLNAKFDRIYYNVTVNAGAGGAVTGGGSIEYGKSVTVKATPLIGYHFLCWYDGTSNVSSSASYTFTPTKNVTLNAVFEEDAPVTYTVTANASTGGTASGGGSFTAGSSATVTATPNSGYHFIGWYEGDSKVSGSASYSFSVSKNVTLTAKFEKDAAPDPGQPDNPQPQPDPNMCHWCGKVHEGFFQKIIGFFHNIMAKIFGAKY